MSKTITDVLFLLAGGLTFTIAVNFFYDQGKYSLGGWFSSLIHLGLFITYLCNTKDNKYV